MGSGWGRARAWGFNSLSSIGVSRDNTYLRLLGKDAFSFI